MVERGHFRMDEHRIILLGRTKFASSDNNFISFCTDLIQGSLSSSTIRAAFLSEDVNLDVLLVSWRDLTYRK